MQKNLETPIQYLNGVGPVMAKKLQRLGIETVRDLLFYFPRHWQDFSNPQKIRQLQIGQEAIIKAKIAQIKQNRTRRRWMSIVEALLADDSGQIRAIWFNQPYLVKVLKPGDEWLFSGKVGYDRVRGLKTINVFQYEKEPPFGKLILPVYPETEGLTSKYLRKLINSNMALAGDLIDDYMPVEVLKEENLISLNQAVKLIHFPLEMQDTKKAIKRLGFDEIFLISLKMLLIKKELSRNKAIVFEIYKDILKKFVESLPFKLTNAQRKSAWEIMKDLNRNIPMNRLLEGDVGSGKTVVAAMAVLTAAQNKLQSVWIAPTEILANQHFKNVSNLFKPFKIKIGMLTSANKMADLDKDDLIIGTHALLQKNVNFSRLGLIIIDEQHRFGVKQRARLRKQGGAVPHLLSMTATPIPRTLALSLYGDLDLSIIDEMPSDRKKIITRVVKPQDRQQAYEFIKKQIENGRQAFVICPLIEAKDKLMVNLFEADRKSVIQEFEKLSKDIFPNLRIGLMHGKLKSDEKKQTMHKFEKGELDVLVSTAVVEVGIDIPNASVMMIEGADRFGLAQLHQFRGRVGRGSHQSYCFLFSESWSDNTKARLGAMVDSQNGFELAEKDLQIRGPGELIGIRQSGLPDLKMASLSDIVLIKQARLEAEKILAEGIEKYPKLLTRLDTYETERHLE